MTASGAQFNLELCAQAQALSSRLKAEVALSKTGTSARARVNRGGLGWNARAPAQQLCSLSSSWSKTIAQRSYFQHFRCTLLLHC